MIDPLLVAGKAIVIPPRPARNVQRAYDRHLYKACHLIENFFARLTQYRCIATRYAKTARNFLGSIHLANAVCVEGRSEKLQRQSVKADGAR